MNIASKNSMLTLLPLVMLITGSIDSIRNLPATALFGETLVFFLVLGAIIFLIPTALIAAQLAGALPKQGGIYQWVKSAFGDKTAVLAIYLQWINTMVWFPTILSFIAATAAYLINAELADNPIYLVSVILLVFWTITIVNLKGIQTSAQIASVCAILGLIIPMMLIIGLAGLWIISGHPLQIEMSASQFIPDFHQSHNWTSLTAIMAAFLGIELAAVHINEVDNAQKTFPKALLLSVIIILVTMLLGALAIAIVLPQDQISLVGGVMQAFTNFLNAYHLSGMINVITVMLLIGSLGGLINWLVSPAKGLRQAAEDGYLPARFATVNQFGVPAQVLMMQGVLVSVICCVYLLLPSINSSYWLLTDLSTQLYMLMYVVMFVSAIKLAKSLNFSQSSFNIPGKQKGLIAVASVGIIGCITSILVGCLSPEGIQVSAGLGYANTFLLGMVIFTSPVLALYWYAYKKQSAINHEEGQSA